MSLDLGSTYHTEVAATAQYADTCLYLHLLVQDHLGAVTLSALRAKGWSLGNSRLRHDWLGASERC